MNFKTVIMKIRKKWGITSRPVLTGLIFAGIFSMVFYVVATTTNYLPIKFPASLPFLVADQTSKLMVYGGALDDSVVDNTPMDINLADIDIANGPNKLAELDQKIKAAGIPIDGLALLNVETHETRIDVRPEATEQQKIQARQIADSFDWTITARDVFNAGKAKQAIMENYSTDKLITLSQYLPIINSFLDQKQFTKIKAMLNGMYLQNIITQEDYMVLSNIFEDQKIYFNPNFTVAQENQPAEPAPAEPAPTEVTPVEVVPPAEITPPVENAPIETVEPVEVVPAEPAPVEPALVESEPAQVEEPVAEAPVAEVPVVEAPVSESPPAEPAPQE